jgi:flagellar biosynthetic protein FliP
MNLQSFSRVKRHFLLFSILSLLSFVCFGADNSALNVFTSSATANGGQNYSLSLQTLILLTALSFLPTIVLMMTSFTRIIIVLSLLRQAIGAQSSPPNQILLGLALFLTFFIMSPVLDRVYGEAYKPLSENKITMQQALDKGSVPIREFMLKQTREADLAMFLNLAGKKVANPNDIPMSVLIPSFMTSELKTGFQIGLSIFIPFLVIDMVVASVLMAMGMMMLPPSIVSLPFKLMLFVLVDGWQLLIGSLANSFR